MAEKTFRQIEAEIKDKGFKALLKEGATEIQNITRTLGYLLDYAADKETVGEINHLCGLLIRSGVNMLKMAESIPDGE